MVLRDGANLNTYTWAKKMMPCPRALPEFGYKVRYSAILYRLSRPLLPGCGIRWLRRCLTRARRTERRALRAPWALLFPLQARIKPITRRTSRQIRIRRMSCMSYNERIITTRAPPTIAKNGTAKVVDSTVWYCNGKNGLCSLYCGIQTRSFVTFVQPEAFTQE